VQPRHNFHWLGRNVRNFRLFRNHHFHHNTLADSFHHLTSQSILQQYGRFIRPMFTRRSNSCSKAILQQKTRLPRPAPGQPQQSIHSLPWRRSGKSRTNPLQERHRSVTLQLLLLNLWLRSARVSPSRMSSRRKCRFDLTCDRTIRTKSQRSKDWQSGCGRCADDYDVHDLKSSLIRVCSNPVEYSLCSVHCD
jgi:hypothetical protein